MNPKQSPCWSSNSHSQRSKLRPGPLGSFETLDRYSKAREIFECVCPNLKKKDWGQIQSFDFIHLGVLYNGKYNLKIANYRG